MIYHNDHLFERFDVLFGKKNSIVAGQEYPLGYFATEALDVDDALLEGLKKLTQQASREFDTFLTARTASSAGAAIQELDRAWELVRQLPLYNKIPFREGRGSSVSGIASFREIYMQTEEDEDLAYMNGRRFNFPVNISFVVERDQKTGQPFIAERMTFEDLISFLYMDLYRGMAAGNIPRLCHNCSKWFLAIGAYDTVYCQRVAPGETTRTCRQVGAHRKEREKNGKDFAFRKYVRVYARLKTWKQRGKISEEKWHRQAGRRHTHHHRDFLAAMVNLPLTTMAPLLHPVMVPGWS